MSSLLGTFGGGLRTGRTDEGKSRRRAAAGIADIIPSLFVNAVWCHAELKVAQKTARHLTTRVGWSNNTDFPTMDGGGSANANKQKRGFGATFRTLNDITNDSQSADDADVGGGEGMQLRIQHLEKLPESDKAAAILRRIRKEFATIIQKRGWSVTSVTEMCCCGDGLDCLKKRKTKVMQDNVSVGYLFVAHCVLEAESVLLHASRYLDSTSPGATAGLERWSTTYTCGLGELGKTTPKITGTDTHR